MNKTIEITVTPDGKSRVETTGFVGSECQQASRIVEQALGRRVSEALTPEFHTIGSQQQQLPTGS